MPEDRETLLSNRRTATLGAALVQHWADDPHQASKRVTAQLELRHASRFIGSDRSVQFNRATTDVSSELSSGSATVSSLRRSLMPENSGARVRSAPRPWPFIVED